jgi:hypothetical protein
MKSCRNVVISVGLTLAVCVALESHSGNADTVYLKNGYTIEGKATDNREQSGEVRIDHGEVGYSILRGTDVDKIVVGDTKPAATPEYVTVKVKKSASYYGKTSYRGILSPQSDDETVVLEIPGAGKIFLSREGAEITQPDPRALSGDKEPPSEERLIQTTHKILLQNGNVLLGNLVPTAESEPVKLAVGGLGVITIARDRILPDGIQSLAGTIKLPPEPAEPPRDSVPEEMLLPENLRQEVLEQLRAEILDELLNQIIDEKLDPAIEAAALREFGRQDQGHLTLEEIQEIQLYVANLSRQRPRERVWGERQLERVGSAALPFLQPVEDHPLGLVRRGVQRLVAYYDDPRGAPMAIRALNDPDDYVREIAGKALVQLLPKSGVKYNSRARAATRAKAQEQYVEYWTLVAADLGREAVYEKLTRNIEDPTW